MSPADAPALCREISVDITDGQFQKKTEWRAGAEEESDKEGKGAKERDVSRREHFMESLLTFLLAVSYSSPG